MQQFENVSFSGFFASQLFDETELKEIEKTNGGWEENIFDDDDIFWQVLFADVMRVSVRGEWLTQKSFPIAVRGVFAVLHAKITTPKSRCN